jgi:hypothetical protein
LLQSGPTHGNFNPSYCRKVIRSGAVACAIVILPAVIGLLIQPAQCTGWLATERNGFATLTSFYIVTSMAALAALWLCFVALRWGWFVQKVINQIQWPQAKAPSENNPIVRFSIESTTRNNVDGLFVAATLGWIGFCTVPLILMVVKC